WPPRRLSRQRRLALHDGRGPRHRRRLHRLVAPKAVGKGCGPAAVVVGSDSMRGANVPGFRKDTPGTVRRYLALVGILAILILAPLSDWRSLRQGLADRYYAGEVYQVSRYEQRYDAMRPLLPKYGVVGYLSDRMEPNEQYRLTVYTLIPLRLPLSPD